MPLGKTQHSFLRICSGSSGIGGCFSTSPTARSSGTGSGSLPRRYTPTKLAAHRTDENPLSPLINDSGSSSSSSSKLQSSLASLSSLSLSLSSSSSSPPPPPQPVWKQRQWDHHRTTKAVRVAATAAAAAAALAAAALLLVPTAAHAVVAGNAAAAATAPTWYSSLAETGFYQAFSLVFVSELGDKTFFIAGLLAMKTSRLISFVGSMGALAVMTIISVVIGQVFHVVPAGLANGIPLDDVAAVLAFCFFGIKTLQEALAMDDNPDGVARSGGGGGMDDELAEAEEAVKENQGSVLGKNSLGQVASIFALVFAAEFGDRSFLSTIALSAAQNPVSVAGGAIAAHALATGVAVAGGAVVAKYLSEKVIGLIGGTLFLVFAATTALGIF